MFCEWIDTWRQHNRHAFVLWVAVSAALPMNAKQSDVSLIMRGENFNNKNTSYNNNSYINDDKYMFGI